MNRRGLVAHYKYHGSVDATGVWNDLSGNDNNGTLVSNAFVDNQGVNLDGGGDYVNLGDNITASDVGSISLWVNIIDDSHGGYLFSAGTTTVSSNFLGVELFEGDKVTIQHHTGPGRNNVMYANQVLNAETWYHVVITTDGSEWKIYIDGDSKNLGRVVGVNSGKWFNDLSAGIVSFALGRNKTTSEEAYFKGFIGEAMIFNRTLSAEEILQIYHETKGRH